MDNYKKAIFDGTRIQTTKGPMSAEQLCQLSIPDLDSLAVSLEIAHNESGKKSFVRKSTAKDKEAKFKFDLVLDILNTKVELAEAAAAKAERKAKNEKIMAIIADKQDESLKGKTVKQLYAMLEEE